MLLALVFAALLLAVLAVVVWPLLAGARAQPDRGQFDRAVYRDQLREVDRDVARGVLNAAEAGSARLEIQRRLLSTEAPTGAPVRSVGRGLGMAAAVAVFVALVGGGLYWQLGAPELPDAQVTARVNQQPRGETPGTAAADATPPPHQDMKVAAERLEQKLRADPNNGEGWVLYARTESMLNDWQKAMDAYKRAIDLGQKGADVYSGYGEMLVLSAQGVVPPAAHEAFLKARALDPKDDVARFYLALADAQAGEVRKAIDAWLALAADVPDSSPMRQEIARRIADAAQSGGIPAPPLPKGLAEDPAAAQPGPTPEQMAEAEKMTPAEREKLVGGMIAQLATRLQSEPNDLDGWLRLGRAYAVKGDAEKAGDAYDHALKLKPDDPAIKLQAATGMLAYLKPGDPLPPRAIGLLREVAKVQPDAPEVLWYLGVVAAREGHADEARQSWTRLLAGLPSNGEDYKMVQAALGQLKAP
jgi:cytochrome c-type biogenesis protein CcmH